MALYLDSYSYDRYPEDLDRERRERAFDNFMCALAALAIFFAGVWVGLVVTP